MRQLISIGLILPGLFLLGSCGSSPGQGSGDQDPVQILECVKVDSVPADFPVSFVAVSREGSQYLAYYNKNRYLTVAARVLNDDHFQYRVLPTRVGWDSHNSITMTLDRKGCIHLSGNMHNDTLLYYKSANPGDIGSLERVFPMIREEDELRCTYPSFIKDADGKLYFSYRTGGSGNGVTIINRYKEEEKSFKRLSQDPLFNGLGEMSAYKSGPRLGPDAYFHVAWLWRDTPACETNHDLSYARSKDLLHWQAPGEEGIRVPITPRDHRFTVDPVPPGGGVINGNFQLLFDREAQPLIAYLKYDEAGNNQVYLASLNAGKWVSTQISVWDYRWEFSGPGSIEFEIRIGKAKLDAKGDILISYEHIKEGPGELQVNGKTLELIQDREVDPREDPTYPQALAEPLRVGEAMQVRWQGIGRATENPDSYYVLRWETQGKRRYYKAPEIPVKPSVLMLYQFQKSEQ